MRTGVCVTSENDIHPYIPLRILRISIQAMVLCQLQWHQHCDVNVRALTGLLTNTHNVPYPCTASLCTMPCIPALHHYPQCPASLYCTLPHNALHHYPQCCQHGFLFPPRCGGFPTSPTLGSYDILGPQRWGGWDRGEQLPLQLFSWLFLCLLFYPGPWASKPGV